MLVDVVSLCKCATRSAARHSALTHSHNFVCFYFEESVTGCTVLSFFIYEYESHVPVYGWV